MMDFYDIFDQKKQANSKRDKFLSRLFGIFSEEIVRTAFRSGQNKSVVPFVDLGRPTLHIKENGQKTKERYTLDFLLQDAKGDIFVTEMKCELEYQGYKYLELNSKEQAMRHQKKPAFSHLLGLAEAIKLNQVNEMYEITCNGAPIEYDRLKGVALIWGKTTPAGVAAVKDIFRHVISVEDVVNDSIKRNDKGYAELVEQYSGWCSGLFEKLSK
jgi:hypothetical protein